MCGLKFPDDFDDYQRKYRRKGFVRRGVVGVSAPTLNMFPPGEGDPVGTVFAACDEKLNPAETMMKNSDKKNDFFLSKKWI